MEVITKTVIKVQRRSDKVDDKNTDDILLQVTLRLEDLKNITSAIGKGVDYEIGLEKEELQSALRVVRKMVEEILCQIKQRA